MKSENDMAKRPVALNGNVLFVGAAFPPSIGGSVVVMQELLRNFDPKSYNVVTLRANGDSGDSAFERRTLRVGVKRLRPYRLGMWVRFLQVPFTVRKACRYAVECEAKAIVCIFPTIDFLLLANLMAKRTGLPLILYLHDTIVEALSGSTFALPSRILQKSVFKRASRIMVMSEGMERLYLQKYGLKTYSIPHTYPEKIDCESDLGGCVTRQLFWGGAVYNANNHALARVVAAAKLRSVPFLFTTKNSKALMNSLGECEESSCVKATYYGTRAEYLSALPVGGILVLALNYPDETEYGEEEVGTIFPTKTPEYLASGAPILVHCPEHYFIAKYVKEKGCGLVVSERDPEVIAMAIERLLSNDSEVRSMRLKARETARDFEPMRICEKFSRVISEGC